MITEGLILGGVAWLLYRKDNLEKIEEKKRLKKQEKEFINKWKLTMKYNGIKNKNEQTFEVLKYIPKKYGCDAIISLPLGLSYEDLFNIKDVIESSLSGIVDMEWKQFDNCIYLKFAKEQVTDDYKYTPIKTKPWELVLGITPFMEIVKSDMSKNPMTLVSGSNNSGKTYCVLTALTNLVNQHDTSEIELYLAQISNKKDLRKFANVKQCKYYAETPEKALLMYKHIHNILVRRNMIFNNVKEGYVDNVFEYNKRFPKKKLSFIYVVADEFSFYMPSSVDSEEVTLWKQQCLDLIFQIIKEGRSAGVYLIASLQRPDRQNMESSTKSQFNTKVIFKQNNNASSLVVCDSDEATKLKQREAIVWMDDKKLMKTMYLDNKMIEQYISDKIEKDHKYLNLDGYLNKNININKENEQKTIKNQEKSNKTNKNTIKNQENTKKATNKITGRVKK